MRKLILTILFATGMTISFAQPNPDAAIKDSVVLNQKFYFPPALFNDSVAISNAIPKLAEQLLTVYTEAKKKKYYENASYYYLLTGDYKKAMALVDSVQKIDGDPSFGIEIKSYAVAKIKEKTQAGSFDDTFKKDFAAAFNKLSFRKKVSMAFLDTTALKDLQTDYKDFTQKLKENKTDSLSQSETKDLCDKFSYYSIYNKIFPLMSPFISDPKYTQSFPAIKGYKWSGVVPVQDLDEIPDPTMKYKLLMELTAFAPKDQDTSAKKEINAGLGEIGRKVNLHVANGIPKKNIDLVIVVHAGALFAFLSNEKYKKKYGLDNPNITFIKELQDFGAKIILCGQAMTFLKLEREDMVPGLKQALTAQTVLSSYQLKNYVYYDIKLD